MGTLRSIRSGCSFVTTRDGKPVTLYGGDKLELDGDVAAAHADKLEPLTEDELKAIAAEKAAAAAEASQTSAQD